MKYWDITDKCKFYNNMILISQRRLNVSEIKQIAGRAGRKGIYDKGYVTAMTDLNLIKTALNSKTNKIEKCFFKSKFICY